SPGGKFLALTPELYDYLLARGHNDDPILKELAEETRRVMGPWAGMQIAPEQGTFMRILAAAIGARSAVEVGTFTGYSSICVARALGADGRMLCLDVSEESTSIARRYWDRAGVASRITLKLGPAADTLRAMPVEDAFDFAFIDADKTNYRTYYEEILKRLRIGGLILFDNVLWNGSVVNPGDQNDDTKAIRALNDFIASDDRVDAVMLPVSDGLTIVRKR
ncbi:MAG TPA: class I SAM-dependent methyltransferase, partial [Candidatus Binataceae bacterium]|nr:class I SAM-dependent methyltransferase [Candidatus Binataceae bacterium]